MRYTCTYFGSTCWALLPVESVFTPDGRVVLSACTNHPNSWFDLPLQVRMRIVASPVLLPALCCRVCRKRKLLTRDDLQLPWLPVYKLFKEVFYAKELKMGMKNYAR